MKIFRSDVTQTWHVSFQSESGEQDVDTAATTREKAEEICRLAKIAELEKAASVSRLTAETITRLTAGYRITLKEAAEKFRAWIEAERSPSTAHSTMVMIEAFLREQQLEEMTPAQVTTSMVTRHINRPDLKLSTRKVQRSLISSFFDFCSQSGWLVGNPARRAIIKYADIPVEMKERQRKDVFAPVDIDYLIGRLEGFWRSAVILSSELGLRLSDVCQIEWKSFDFQTNQVVIWMDKTNSRVSLPMTSAVKRLIVSLPQTDKRYVFPEERETYLRSQSTLSWQFKRICASLGMEGKSFHCLRASFATDEYAQLANAKVDHAAMAAVAKSLGHKSPTTTAKHYVKT